MSLPKCPDGIVNAENYEQEKIGKIAVLADKILLAQLIFAFRTAQKSAEGHKIMLFDLWYSLLVNKNKPNKGGYFL